MTKLKKKEFDILIMQEMVDQASDLLDQASYVIAFVTVTNKVVGYYTPEKEIPIVRNKDEAFVFTTKIANKEEMNKKFYHTRNWVLIQLKLRLTKYQQPAIFNIPIRFIKTTTELI